MHAPQALFRMERNEDCGQRLCASLRYLPAVQPLPVPDSAWQVISMDFIEGLPLSHSYNCILAGVSMDFIDGQTERLNQCLETYLRCYVHACPEKWSQWLPSAELWYNTCHHSAIGRSPFEALYGYSLIPHVCWPLILHRHPTLKSLLGHLTDSGWINSYSSICIVLSPA